MTGIEEDDDGTIPAQVQEFLLNSVGEAANAGVWELNLETMTPNWSRQTRRIHEVDDDFVPNLDNALDFYPPGARELISANVENCFQTGEGFSVDLPFITAKGRPRWVRSVGKPILSNGRVVKLVGAFQDITEQKIERERREFVERLLRITTNAQTAILRGDSQTAFDTALHGLCELTGSAFGFIAEALHDPDGTPFIKTAALTNIAWNEETQRLCEDYSPNGLEFRNLNSLFGIALTSKKAVVSNCPEKDDRRAGLPPGHPPLTSFLGIPLLVSESLVGMVGLANRPHGYDSSVEDSLRPLLDSLGHLLVSWKNSRALAESEETLRRERMRFSNILYGTEAGTWEWNVQTGHVEFNERWAEIVGYRLEELEPSISTWIAFCHPDDLAESNRLLQAHFKGDAPNYTFEARMRHRDGRWVWVMDRGKVVTWTEDGQPLLMTGTHLDVTERHQADEKLREATTQLSAFFEVSLDFLCVATPDGYFMHANDAFERGLGYSTSELQGKRFLDLIHPDDVEPTLGAMSTLDGGEPLLNFVNRYLHKNGHYIPVEWRAAATNGLYYAAGRDISERLASEADLKRALDRAEMANRAKSVFLANMSHEIRTPLNGVVGIVGALARTHLDSRQQEMVDLIRSSGETLERLLSDILDVSRIEEGKLNLLIEAFDLRQSIETAAHIMQVRADEKGVGFTVDYSENAHGLFLGDVVRIRQIVSNLASNAVKFTEKGTVAIKISVDDLSASDDVTASCVLQIIVEDSGIGFDNEAKERLFSRFEQADGSITRSFGGSGLGLSICKAIIDMMQGSIQVESQPGRGSRFLVTLPLRRAAVDSTKSVPVTSEYNSLPRPAEQPATLQAQTRILVAEDLPLNQRIVSLILEPHDVHLTFAANGREAVDLYVQNDYDVILMDMQMPEMDGLAATQAIRSLETAQGRRRIPIAMLSANSMKEHIQQALDVGCDNHIPKPVTPTSLVAGIVAALAATPRPSL